MTCVRKKNTEEKNKGNKVEGMVEAQESTFVNELVSAWVSCVRAIPAYVTAAFCKF